MTLLQFFRVKKGLTQAELGAQAGIHPATISALEHRTRTCWPALRRRLATVLEVSETILFDERGWPLENEEIDDSAQF
jgi:transcriptional regulator with XRE-family HTH domain